MHFTLARIVPLISLLAQHSTWNIGWSHAPRHSPILIRANIFVRTATFVPLTVNSMANSPAADSVPVVLSHWCRNLALDQHGSLSPSSRTRLLDSGIWSGSDQRNTFPN